MKARCIATIVLGLLMGAAATAQPPAGADPRAELQREMGRFFAQRLRAELSLSDEQAKGVVPRLQALERERAALRRERQELARNLRRAMEQGAGDRELRTMLDRLDRTEAKELELKRSALSDIDGELTVRQSVQLRFFVESFQRMLREKIMDIRGDPGSRAPGAFRRPQGGR